MRTEDLKPKRAVEKRASDGMFKHLMVMVIHKPIFPLRVWNQISAENQLLLVTQFGATQQIQLQDLNTVTQLKIIILLSPLIRRKLLPPKYSYKPRRKVESLPRRPSRSLLRKNHASSLYHGPLASQILYLPTPLVKQ